MRVSRQELIRALSVQEYRNAVLLCETLNQIRGENARRGKRLFLMVAQSIELADEKLWTWKYADAGNSRGGQNSIYIGSFIETRVGHPRRKGHLPRCGAERVDLTQDTRR